MAKKRHKIDDYATKKEAMVAASDRPPAFTLGEEDGWFIERSYVYGVETIEVQRGTPYLEDGPYVRLVERQRRGWYLIPNPIHNILRQFINGVVVVLLVCLFYLFISLSLIHI